MKIELQRIKIKDLIKNYSNNIETGAVVGFDGSLNIRPSFQREFVYDDKKKKAVIETVRKGFPLNTFYWSKNADNSYEMIDGQQRTISICEFMADNYSVIIDGNWSFCHNLRPEDKDKILNYELQVYICEGTDPQLELFKRFLALEVLVFSVITLFKVRDFIFRPRSWVYKNRPTEVK